MVEASFFEYFSFSKTWEFVPGELNSLVFGWEEDMGTKNGTRQLTGRGDTAGRQMTVLTSIGILPSANLKQLLCTQIDRLIGKRYAKGGEHRVQCKELFRVEERTLLS